MADLDGRFRSLGRTPAPDLWDEIHRREPSPAPGPSRGRRILVAAVAFAVAIASVSLTMWIFRPGTTPPAPGATVRNGAIAFTSGDGRYHIATVTLDGAVTELSEPRGEDYDLSPVWSPEGTAIAFLRYTEYTGTEGEDAYDYELVVSRPDGTGIVDLDQPAANFAWSDDGSAIVLSTFQKGSDYDVFVVRPDGSDRTSIVATPLTDVQPSWSPAGDAIAFVSHPVLDRDPGDADIYVVRADGTNVHRLTGGPEWDYSPVWSPDGTAIAYLSEHVDEREIYVMDPDGSGRTAVTDAPTNDVVDPVWSPDGTKIAFTVYSGSSWDVYIVNADGTGQRALANSPLDETGPEWSPDASLVAYSAAQSGESCECDNAGTFDIYIVRPDGTGMRRLTNGVNELGGDLSWQRVSE
jgi:Tol biopolymer transport system component